MPIETTAPISLPEPGDAALSHSRELVAMIRDEIGTAGGVIGFDHYMNRALYAPGYGYYAAGARKLGAEGDFVTAPEMSPLFSRCVANQVAEVLEALGGGDVVEFGAGSGTFAGELMRVLLQGDVAPPRYLILETSPDLKHRQAELLTQQFPECHPYFQWIDDFPPAGFRGVLLANELLDAFPASRFQILDNTVTELGVGWDYDRFTWATRRPSPVLEEAVAELLASLPEPLPPGYISEISLTRGTWITEMLERIDEGVAILFDYGYLRSEYYHPQRVSGTLCCYYRHRMHDDPLILTGLQDITTHVDFSAVAASARECGAGVLGYTTQANFLLGTGLLEALGKTAPGTRAHTELTAQVKRLTLPGEMGELIKVIALSRNFDLPLSGFRERDLRGQI